MFYLKNYRRFYFIFFVLTSLISYFTIKQVIVEKEIKDTGETIEATIKHVPMIFSKSPGIKIEINSQEYVLNVPRSLARKGAFRSGEKVKVIYSPKHQKVIWPERNVNFGIRFVWLILIMPIWCLFEFIRWSKKKKTRRQRA